MPKNENLAKQIRQDRLLARVRAIKAIDKSQEPYLATELKWLSESMGVSNARWMMRELSGVYQKGGDSLRAVLLNNRLPETGSKALFPDSRKLDQILAFAAQPGKPAFDEFLASNYSHGKPSLLEMKALNELYAGRWKSAAELLAQAGPEIAGQQLRADPFMIHNLDCHDCDFEAKHKDSYTKASFVKKLIELSQKAERTDAEGAQASFLLANGLYNMSYYGNARDVYAPKQGSPAAEGPSLAPNSRMDLAEKYYKRAMELSHDKEFKAKACFMAAKTEQNRYFNASSSSTAGDETAVHSPVYFKKLKDSFADTRYYQEIIKECGYFRRYLGKK
jgi:hypothetical protein